MILSKIWDTILNAGIWLFLIIPLIIGIIGVIIERIRNGHSWIGQGYGKK